MPDPPSNQQIPTGAQLLGWDEIPSTRWTLVERAGDRLGQADSSSALEELLRLYLPVLRAHLLGTLRLSADQVDDLLQGFLADRILERNLVAQADSSRGQFRRFLRTSLNHYVTDMHRRQSAARRKPASGRTVSLAQIEELAGAEPTAAARFDRLWANEVLAEVMRRARSTCQADNQMAVWTVLEARILLPVTTGAAPLPHAELARQLRLNDATQSANLLAAGKQLFTQTFRQVVSEYLNLSGSATRSRDLQEQAISEEIRDLWTIFAARSR